MINKINILEIQEKKLLYDLFEAYYDCRKNKRNTANSINFELNYESNIIKLRDDIISGNYEVGKSIAFIVDKPVKREIFAWDFRDRIVHHYIINKLDPYFEKNFIYDSYSCREKKWTLFWVKRVEKFIRSCSENYSKDCYILKLDIKGFFMSINKDILWEKLVEFIELKNLLCSIFPFLERRSTEERGEGLEKQLIFSLLQKIIYNDPTKNCIIKWDKSDWRGLPKSKSLFFAQEFTGLPIWNLTSQVFANFYLDFLDKFVKQNLKIRYYGRYVDDFVLIHPNKNYLKYCQKEIEIFLKNELKLTLHPNKIYLQHYSKWILFLGSFIKPYRKYLKNQTKWNIYKKIEILNNEIRKNKWKLSCHSRAWKTCKNPAWKTCHYPAWLDNLSQNFRQTINSYLWLIKWNNSYKFRKKILLKQVSSYFWNYFYISGWYKKVVNKKLTSLEINFSLLL